MKWKWLFLNLNGWSNDSYKQSRDKQILKSKSTQTINLNTQRNVCVYSAYAIIFSVIHLWIKTIFCPFFHCLFSLLTSPSSSVQLSKWFTPGHFCSFNIYSIQFILIMTVITEFKIISSLYICFEWQEINFISNRNNVI